eukprot:TCONS_00066868-protein
MAQFGTHEQDVSNFYSRIADMSHDYNKGFLTFGLWETKDGDPIDPPRCYEEIYDEMLAGSQILKHHRVLEVACGQGSGMLKIHKKYGCDITGLDISIGNVEISKRRLQDAGLSVIHGSATDIPHPDASFDFVLCVEGMPHFNTREDFFREAYRVLKPGGKLLLGDIVSLHPIQDLSLYKRLFLQAALKIWVSRKENCNYGLEGYQQILKNLGFGDTELDKVGHRVFPQYTKFNLTIGTIREQAKIRGPFVGYFGGPIIDWIVLKLFNLEIIDYILLSTEKET